MENVCPSKEFGNGTLESIEEATRNVMEECSGYDSFLISSGCGIPSLSPWTNIDAFFATVEKVYRCK